MKTGSNVILSAAAAFLVPFLGFLMLVFGGETVKAVFFQNYFVHSVLLLVTCGLALYTSYIAYRQYCRSKDVRVFTVALAFYVFGFVFLTHAVSIPVWRVFSEAVFDVSEHYGLFFGSVILLGLVLPLASWQENIFVHKGRIFSAVAVFFLFGFISLIVFPPLAAALEGIVNVAIILTSLLFALSLIFLIRQYRRNPHPLLFYLIMGIAVLLNSAIIPLFYKEWGLLWWYFHLTFLTGFATISAGIVETSAINQMSNVNGQMSVSGFESVFGDVPFYSRIGAKLWLWAGAILAALVILGLVVWIQLGQLDRSFKELSKENYEMHLVMTMSLAISRTLMPPNDYLVTGGDTNEPANFEKLVQEAEAVFLELEPYTEKLQEKSFIADAKENFTQIKVKSRQIFAMPRDQARVSTESGRLMEEIDIIGEKAITRIQEWDEISDAEIAEQEKNVAASQKIIVITIMFLLALAITITGVFGSLIIRSIIGPFERLLGTVKKILQGDLRSRVEVTSDDEIGELSKSFNTMTENLLVVRKYPENIIRTMLDSLIMVDTEGKIKEMNQSALDLLGFTLSDVAGQPSDKIISGQVLQELMKTPFITNFEAVLKPKAGGEIPVLVSGSGMKDEAGQSLGYVVVAKDMREYKKSREQLEASEQQLRAGNQQLTASNQQLSASQKELQDKLLELNRFNQVAVGRELKMMELKEEIADLKKKLEGR